METYILLPTRPFAALTGSAPVNLESCLPAELQGPSTTIVKVAAGLSGAGVYRVDANGASYALKISDSAEPIERWRSKRDIQQLASDADLAPRIVHVDEGRRATLSEFLVDQSFPARFGRYGQRHNDVNPSNLVYDGDRIMLLDWEVAGRNDRYCDLAAIAVFMRMDAETCRRFIELHDGVPVTSLPARFLYVRRMIATLLGSMFMRLPGDAVRAGLTGAETPESVLSLAEFYQAMRAGALNLASTKGQIAFAMALIKESVTL